jgi:hypothetical protein
MKTFAFMGLLVALSNVDDYLPREITVPEGEGVMMHLYSESFKPFLENSKLKGEYTVSVILNGELVTPYSDFLSGNFLSNSLFENEYKNDADSTIKIDKLQDSFFIETYFEELEKDSVGNRKIKGKFVKVSFTANQSISDFNISSYLVDSTGKYTDSEYKKILFRRPKGEVKWQYPNDFISTSSVSFDKDTDYDLYIFPHSRTPNGDADDTSELERYLTFIKQGYFEDTWESSVFEYYSGKKILLVSSFNPKLGAVVSKRQLLDGNALIFQQLDGIESTPVFKINKDIIAAGEKLKLNFRISNISSNKEYLSKEVLVNVVDSECESKNILNAFYVPEGERYKNVPPIFENLQYPPIYQSNLGFTVTLPINWLPDLEYMTAGENKGYRVVGNSVYLDFVKDHGSSYDPDREYLNMNLDFGTLKVKFKVSGCEEKEVDVQFEAIEFSGVPVINDPIGVPLDEVLSVALGESINIPLEISDSDANLAVVTAELRKPSADGDASFLPIPVSRYRLGPNLYDSGGRNTHFYSNYTIQLPVIPFDPAMKPFEEFMWPGILKLSDPEPEPGEYDLYIVAQDTDGNVGVMVKKINILENPNIKKVEPIILTNYSGQLPLDGYLAIEFTVSDDQAGAYMVWSLIENHEIFLYISSVVVFREESGEHIYRDSLEACYFPGEYYFEPGKYIVKISTNAELSYQPASEFSDLTFDFAISNESNFSFDGSEDSPLNYCSFFPFGEAF